ncbi:hypothetical protein DPMN_085164 [Dreissena polymorpha]|uniref:Uncharacterized protein n=1 Tax=Dreissena polymorpha TaxID=45954 RepID=A0A9D4BK22_DREPO|nr:hypothetical protein DPMN_085164 [Dreissena polymorpha]
MLLNTKRVRTCVLACRSRGRAWNGVNGTRPPLVTHGCSSQSDSDMRRSTAGSISFVKRCWRSRGINKIKIKIQISWKLTKLQNGYNYKTSKFNEMIYNASEWA